MAVENLWGDLKTLQKVHTPRAILREQAQLLTESTGGTLVGDVSDFKSASYSFCFQLRVVIPILNNYQYELLEIRHNETLYPLMVTDLQRETSTSSMRCKNEIEYIEALKQILGADHTKDVLARLLSQATS